MLSSFHPKMALLADLGVNLRDFLELAQNYQFPDWKLKCAQTLFPDGQ